MSQENVDLIRQRFEAFNQGDLATMVELTDPAAVWWDRSDDPWGGAPHRGRDACMQHLAEILEDAELEAHPQEFIDAGMRVVVGVQLVGRGRTSGVAFEEHEFHVFTLRDGRVIETREYRERDEALKAVGLSEQDASKTNIGVVRALTEAWNAGEMELIREALHPEVFMRSPEGWPESGPFFGRDAVIRAFEQLRETFDSDWHELISEPVAVGDRVAVRTIWHGKGHGPELKQESTHVYTVRDERVVQLEFFSDHDEALRAIGAA